MEKCELPKQDRHDVSKRWKNGANTLLTQSYHKPSICYLKKKKKKKKAVSAKHSKTRYACIRKPVSVYRDGQNSERLLKYTVGFCQHECYVKTYFPQAS